MADLLTNKLQEAANKLTYILVQNELPQLNGRLIEVRNDIEAAIAIDLEANLPADPEPQPEPVAPEPTKKKWRFR
jgi:hypothetical protein